MNNYASAVVRVARKHPEGLGCARERDVLDARIDFEDMERLPDAATERSLLHAVVELCLEKEVALREGEQLVFPSKFNRERPEYPEPPLREVSYTFEGTVEDIYATLVVRLFYCGSFKLKDLWKNAGQFQDSLGKICCFQMKSPDEGHGEISVFFHEDVSIDSKVLFLQFIHEHLRKTAQAGSVKRERIYGCLKCKKEIKDKDAVESRLKAGKKKIRCQYCDEEILLLDLLEEKFGDPELLQRVREMEEEATEKKEEAVGVTTLKAKEEIGEFDVFLAHNSEDKSAVKKIGEDLKKAGVRPWLDEWQVPPFGDWQEELEKVISKIRTVAVLVGPSGVGPWEKMEIRAFLMEFVERKIKIGLVWLPGCPEDIQIPLFMKVFGWVDFRKDEPDPLGQLIWGITGERPPEKGGY
ncbi:MAG: toll/interleukin-1 receptor domain-containing protein [bacterium]